MNTNENNKERQRTVRQNQPPRPGQRIPSSTAPQQSVRPPLQEKPTPASTKSAARMPKARALALVNVFKRWIVMTSLVGFLSLSGLAALHRTSTTTTSSTHIASATTASKKGATVKATATTKPKTTAKATTKKKQSVKATATPTHSSYSFGASTPTPTPVTTSSVS